MDSLISVVLPVYNGGEYLKSAIESILNQTHKNIELIIINDASKDNSINLIKKYKEQDERILFINHETNKGLIETLNEGISISRGKYIARMDQDDVCIDTRLELQYQHMLQSKDDICGGHFSIMYENGDIFKKSKVAQTAHGILLVMASNVPFAHPSVMIKKSFLIKKGLKYGMHGKYMAEDLDLWLTMYNNGAKFGNINFEILRYRILSTSISRVNAKKMKKEKEIQLNSFMKKNKTKYESAFQIFFNQDKLEDELKQPVIRAALRYAMLNINYTVYFKCIKKIDLYNLTIGTLSFIKQRTFF